MKESYPKGPTRLTQRSDIGNGLWWLAKRHMSSWRLSRNHEVIQARIGKLEKRASLRAFRVTLGFTLLFGSIAWGTSWRITNVLPAPAPMNIIPGIVTPPPALMNLRQIRIIAAPYSLKVHEDNQVEPPDVSHRAKASHPEPLTQKVKKSAAAPSNPRRGPRKTHSLSKLLKKFRNAKQAHEDGHLELATKQFLQIAREQLHPSLGPESYLRAIAIIRAQGHHLRALELMNEAKFYWPNLKEAPEAQLR